MSTPPPPPGYGTLPPDPDEPQRGPYPTGQDPAAPYPAAPQPTPPGTPPVYGQQPYGQPQPFGQAPYGQQPMYGAPAGNSNVKTLGIVATVVGVIALPASCCCWFLGWIPALIALGCGAVGLSQAKDDPSAADAKPFLIAGIVLGVLALLLTVASAIWGMASFATGFNDF